jgi:hypothetical protein
MPPDGGWTLIEAARALCPEAYSAISAGGDALLDLRRARFGAWADILPDDAEDHARLILMMDLLAALRARADLALTGRDPARGALADRVELPRDVLLRSEDHNGRHGAQMELSFSTDRERGLPADWLRLDFNHPEARPDLPPALELVSVRIERIATALPRLAAAGGTTAAEVMLRLTDGVRLKREDAMARCRSETGCTWRVALDAWNALPADRKGRARR